MRSLSKDTHFESDDPHISHPKSNRGGARKGAGRPSTFDEPKIKGTIYLSHVLREYLNSIDTGSLSSTVEEIIRGTPEFKEFFSEYTKR